MCQVFTVDDLMHLKRGGRLSGAVAVVGTVLHLKPLLKADEDGKIIVYGKVRGRRASIKALVESCKEKIVDPEKQVLGLVHADSEQDANYLAELLREAVAPKEILMVYYEPVTGAHVGPGALAIFFFGNQR